MSLWAYLLLHGLHPHCDVLGLPVAVQVLWVLMIGQENWGAHNALTVTRNHPKGNSVPTHSHLVSPLLASSFSPPPWNINLESPRLCLSPQPGTGTITVMSPYSELLSYQLPSLIRAWGHPWTSHPETWTYLPFPKSAFNRQ